MSPALSLQARFTVRNGVRLAHFEAGPDNPKTPPLLLINGWTGDHGIFTPQIEYFSATRRVVAIDLRGHGRSDRPEDGYTIPGFAEDIAWQCHRIGLENPVVIGHSFGGAVALELCGRFPGFAAGLIMVDSIVMSPRSALEHPDFRKLLEGIGGPDYLSVSKASAWNIGCDFDDPARRRWIYDTFILGPCESTPQHVAYETLRNAATDYDPVPAACACNLAMAYISADVPLVNMARDLEHLQMLCPQLVQAKTLLAGHFNTIEVADQVNAMIERFLAVGLRRTRAAVAHS